MSEPAALPPTILRKLRRLTAWSSVREGAFFIVKPPYVLSGGQEKFTTSALLAMH
jgi:hypothetical protein